MIRRRPLWSGCRVLTRTPTVFRRGIRIMHEKSNGDPLLTSLQQLREKGDGALAVTDFITQYDELRQITMVNQELPPTKAMQRGSQVHDSLDRSVSLDPSQSYFDFSQHEPMDRNATHCINMIDKLITLGNNKDTMYGVVRELPMRGPNGFGCILKGVIDCAYIGPHGIIVMETKTTRNVTPVLTRLAYHQALTYHWLFSLLLSSRGDAETKIRSLFGNGDTMTIPYNYLDSNAAKVNNALAVLSQIGLAPFVKLQFLKEVGGGVYQEDIYDVEYNDNILKDVLRSRVDFFSGKRDPYGFRLPDIDTVKTKVVDLIGDKQDLLEYTPAEKVALRL